MRRQIAALALSTIWALAAVGQETLPVVHERALWWDKSGELSVNADGIAFQPEADKPEEAEPIRFAWKEIQQLLLGEKSIELVSYRDVTWQFGRDKQFRFELQPSAGGNFAALEERLRRGLGGRLVVATAPSKSHARWSIPAKRTGLFRGVEGELSFTGDELIYATDKPQESRRWPIAAIDSIAQTGPYDFTVVAPERALSDMGGRRSFHFQLKEPLRADLYQELWRAIERAHGTSLRFAGSQ